MEMSAPAEPRSHLDAMRDQISNRRSEVDYATRQQSPYPVSSSNGAAAGPRSIPVPAASKLQAYRDGREAIKAFNRTTEQLLVSPTGQRPANGRASSGASSTSQADSGMYAFPGESPTEALVRVNKANRALTKEVKRYKEECERYRCDIKRINANMDVISSESKNTDQEVLNLADDLRLERSHHERARLSLEHKTVEVQEQAVRLAELEHASNKVHEENLELSSRIQELNRIAEEQREHHAATTAAGGEDDRVVTIGQEGAGAAGGASVEEMETLKKELEKAKAALEYRTRKLEVVNERATKTALELQHYKGKAKSGRFWKFLWSIWSLARVIGFLGFMLFAYVAVSEDAFRSRGVDVYRLAH